MYLYTNYEFVREFWLDNCKTICVVIKLEVWSLSGQQKKQNNFYLLIIHNDPIQPKSQQP